MSKVITGYVGRNTYKKFLKGNKFNDLGICLVPLIDKIKGDERYWGAEWPPVKIRVTVELADGEGKL